MRMAPARQETKLSAEQSRRSLPSSREASLHSHSRHRPWRAGSAAWSASQRSAIDMADPTFRWEKWRAENLTYLKRCQKSLSRENANHCKSTDFNNWSSEKERQQGKKEIHHTITKSTNRYTMCRVFHDVPMNFHLWGHSSSSSSIARSWWKRLRGARNTGGSKTEVGDSEISIICWYRM